jgi:segregation and condensation protein B
MGKSVKLIVEALLFSSEKPLNAKDIHAVMPEISMPDISSALKVLKYEFEAFGRSFYLREISGGYQFRSRSTGLYPENHGPLPQGYPRQPWRPLRTRLQAPVLRQEVERIRGVDVGGVLKTLLENGLIRIMGRKNLPGRPLVYGTTTKFLEVFDLKDLESLPKLKEIEALGIEEETEKAGGESAAEIVPAKEIPPQGTSTDTTN